MLFRQREISFLQKNLFIGKNFVVFACCTKKESMLLYICELSFFFKYNV